MHGSDSLLNPLSGKEIQTRKSIKRTVANLYDYDRVRGLFAMAHERRVFLAARAKKAHLGILDHLISLVLLTWEKIFRRSLLKIFQRLPLGISLLGHHDPVLLLITFPMMILLLLDKFPTHRLTFIHFPEIFLLVQAGEFCIARTVAVNSGMSVTYRQFRLPVFRTLYPLHLLVLPSGAVSTSLSMVVITS
jgi:hypothetical protein